MKHTRAERQEVVGITYETLADRQEVVGITYASYASRQTRIYGMY